MRLYTADPSYDHASMLVQGVPAVVLAGLHHVLTLCDGPFMFVPEATAPAELSFVIGTLA